MYPAAPSNPDSSRQRHAGIPLAAIFLLATLLDPLALHPLEAGQAAPAPLLRVTAQAPAPAFLAFSGQGFSPGRAVLIAIAAVGGGDARLDVWTFASSHDAWGPAGSWPAIGEFVSPGRVRGHIWLDAGATWGPNGSQDPARGYRAVDHLVALRLAVCDQGVDVQAFDADSRTWSNALHLVATC